MEAAARIFEEMGFEAATTNAIAKRAGVSVGSLYQYFPNKLALLDVLRERHFEKKMQRLADACDQGRALSLPDGMRRILEVSTVFEKRGLSQDFHTQLPAIWPDRKGRACVTHFRERLRLFLETHRDCLRVEVERAAFLTLSLAAGFLTSASTERPRDIVNGVVARETAEAILLFLTGSPTGQPASRQVMA